MKHNEINMLETYLQKTFGNEDLKLDRATCKNESIEVILDGEFIGVVYRDEDEGGLSFSFNMAILSEDL